MNRPTPRWALLLLLLAGCVGDPPPDPPSAGGCYLPTGVDQERAFVVDAAAAPELVGAAVTADPLPTTEPGEESGGEETRLTAPWIVQESDLRAPLRERLDGSLGQGTSHVRIWAASERLRRALGLATATEVLDAVRSEVNAKQLIGFIQSDAFFVKVLIPPRQQWRFLRKRRHALHLSKSRLILSIAKTFLPPGLTTSHILHRCTYQHSSSDTFTGIIPNTMKWIPAS